MKSPCSTLKKENVWKHFCQVLDKRRWKREKRRDGALEFEHWKIDRPLSRLHVVKNPGTWCSGTGSHGGYRVLRYLRATEVHLTCAKCSRTVKKIQVVSLCTTERRARSVSIGWRRLKRSQTRSNPRGIFLKKRTPESRPAWVAEPVQKCVEN